MKKLKFNTEKLENLIKKHNFTQENINQLEDFEIVRQSGKMNMYGYMSHLSPNVKNFIFNSYEEFLEILQ